MLTLSLVVCLGAATDARAAGGALGAESATPRTTLTAGQRKALAALLSELTDSARRFQRVAASPAAVLAAQHTRPLTTDAQPPRPTPDRYAGPPTPPLRAALRNLPPPNVR